MRILVICYNVVKPSSGPPSVVRNLLNGFVKIANLLDKKGVDLTLLSLYENIGTIEVRGNIRIVGVSVVRPITLTLELQSFLKHVGNPDIVHTHVLHYVPRFALGRTPTIYTLHGVIWREIQYYRGVYPKVWLALMLLRLKAYLPLITKLVVISPYLIEELGGRRIRLSPNKIALIENPISDLYFDLAKSEDNIILYPARFFPQKNQLGFTKALSLIKEDIKEYRVIFTMGSYLDEKYLAYVKHYVSKKNLKNIEFRRCSLRDMLNLYSRASIVALLSFQETLPMSVLEAMASGTPVLVSRIRAMEFIVDDGITGLLADPSNPKDIAEKLATLINDNNLRREMGRKARRVAEARWKSEVIAKKHLELYDKVIGGDVKA